MIKKYIPFLAVFVVLQILFLLLQTGLENYYLRDSYEYMQAADNFIEEGVLYAGDLSQSEEIHLYTKRPPGYPLFLSISRLFSDSHLPVMILQALLSILSALLMLRIFGKERSENLFFVFLILFMPAQFIYPNLVMSETLFQFTLMLAGWMLFSYFKTENFRYVWAFQLLLCLGIFIKPVLYLFAFVNLGYFIYLYFRHRARLLVISGLVPIIFIIIFSSFNQQKTGKFHVSSIQDVNLIDVNLFYFLMQDEGYDAARTTTDSIYQVCEQNSDYKEYSECLNDAAKEILFSRLFEYGVFHIKGSVRFFIDPGRFDIYNFFGLQEMGEKGLRYRLFQGGVRAVWQYLKEQNTFVLLWIFAIAMINVLKTIGFIFFIFNRRYNLDFRIFLLLLVGTISFATGPLGASRFALPVALFILGGAAVQYHHWYQRLILKKS